MPMCTAPTVSMVAGSFQSGLFSENIGTRESDSTPPDTIRSASPVFTRAAAMLSASSPDAQARLTVVPGTVSGQPTISGAMRAMFDPWSPCCRAAPMTTSSTRAGSKPTRARRFSSSTPSSSIGEQPASPPRDDAFALGVRMAS